MTGLIRCLSCLWCCVWMCLLFVRLPRWGALCVCGCLWVLCAQRALRVCLWVLQAVVHAAGGEGRGGECHGAPRWGAEGGPGPEDPRERGVGRVVVGTPGARRPGLVLYDPSPDGDAWLRPVGPCGPLASKPRSGSCGPTLGALPHSGRRAGGFGSPQWGAAARSGRRWGSGSDTLWCRVPLPSSSDTAGWRAPTGTPSPCCSRRGSPAAARSRRN